MATIYVRVPNTTINIEARANASFVQFVSIMRLSPGAENADESETMIANWTWEGSGENVPLGQPFGNPIFDPLPDPPVPNGGQTKVYSVNMRSNGSRDPQIRLGPLETTGTIRKIQTRKVFSEDDQDNDFNDTVISFWWVSEEG